MLSVPHAQQKVGKGLKLDVDLNSRGFKSLTMIIKLYGTPETLSTEQIGSRQKLIVRVARLLTDDCDEVYRRAVCTISKDTKRQRGPISQFS